MLQDIVQIYKDTNQKLTYQHRGNSREIFLLPIPKANSFKTFVRVEKTQNWIEEIIYHIQTSSNSNSYHDVCRWMIDTIAKKDKESLVAVASKFDLFPPIKMTSIEAASM